MPFILRDVDNNVVSFDYDKNEFCKAYDMQDAYVFETREEAEKHVLDDCEVSEIVLSDKVCYIVISNDCMTDCLDAPSIVKYTFSETIGHWVPANNNYILMDKEPEGYNNIEDAKKYALFKQCLLVGELESKVSAEQKHLSEMQSGNYGVIE